MPTVKIVAGNMSIELDANEISVGELCKQGLETLEKAHEIERAANEKRAAGVGGYA